jgi:hypothetical protein
MTAPASSTHSKRFAWQFIHIKDRTISQRWTARGKWAAVLRWGDLGKCPSTLNELHLDLKSHLVGLARTIHSFESSIACPL